MGDRDDCIVEDKECQGGKGGFRCGVQHHGDSGILTGEPTVKKAKRKKRKNGL